jgi:hypothetical protein
MKIKRLIDSYWAFGKDDVTITLANDDWFHISNLGKNWEQTVEKFFNNYEEFEVDVSRYGAFDHRLYKIEELNEYRVLAWLPNHVIYKEEDGRISRYEAFYYEAQGYVTERRVR